MKPASARALLVASFLVLVLAGMIGSPEGRLFAAAAGGLCALPPLFAGTRGMKAGAALLLFALGALAWHTLPAARDSMGSYRARAHGAQPSRRE
jgi:hypothetical protein